MFRKFLILFFTLVSLSSCASPVGLTNFSYSDLQGNDRSLDGTILNFTDNKIKNNKRGVSCVENILSLFAIGDSSIESAKNNGDVQNVSYAYTTYEQVTFYLPLYQKGCTVVRGT